MPRCPRLLLAALALGAWATFARGDDKPAAPCAAAVDDYFRDEVWVKVGAAKCLTCHKAGGDAEGAAHAPARSSSATHSICGVCGNMSTGLTRRSL